MSRKYNKKYVFTLIGVNINKVENKYGIVSAKREIDEIIPQNTTRIDDLDINKKNEILSFLDESKRLRKCIVSMIDFNTQKNIVGGIKNTYKCFWDKNYFPDNIQAIGCPIKYFPSKAKKSYHSEISKENYTIVENVSTEKQKYLSDKKDPKINIEEKNFYQTDGIFCSFNCCMAFINCPENKKNPLYRYSETLLLKMFLDINPDESLEIMPAPHWRNLIDFGGTLTIEQFRDSFNKVLYVEHGNHYNIVCTSLGKLYEDQLKF